MDSKRVVSILLIIFGLMFATGANAHEGEDHIIEMGKDNFSPLEVTVEKGETVTFINSDTSLHWPASDIHPTHSIYPEFDSKRGLKPGESWSFAFDKVGEWRFHDHLFPNRIGKIIVTGDTPDPSPEAKTTEKRQILVELKTKLVQFYYKLFPKKLESRLERVNMHKVAQNEEDLKYWITLLGPHVVMTELVNDTNGGTLADCHQEAHRVGRISYEIFGSSVFSKGNSSCHSGYYHGAMEAFLKEKGTTNLAKNINDICNAFPTSFTKFECLHGVGHGVMAYLSYDLPESIKLCDKLNEANRTSCYGGVFMENIVAALGIGAISGHETKWVSGDPLFPCNAIENRLDLQTQCYLMQTSRMLQLFRGDYMKIAEQCSKVDKTVVNTCFISLGRDAAGSTLRNPEGIINICSKVPEDYKNNCYAGAVNVIVDFWGENIGDKPYDLCAKIPVVGNKDYCYGIVFGRLMDIFGGDPTKIEKSCGLLENPYKQMCLDRYSYL